MMNGKHRAPRKYTHIEKIRIMNDAVVFMFGCMTLVCEIRVRALPRGCLTSLTR